MCACGKSTTADQSSTSAQLTTEQSNMATQAERNKVLADMSRAIGNTQR